MGEGIDDVGMNAQQTQFKNLKQTDRACTDDESIGFNRALHGLCHAASRC
jgi:hypothetical protein